MKKFDLSGDKPELALCAPVAEFDIILMEIILRMLDQEKTQRMMHSKEAAALRCKYLGGNIPYGFAVNDATGGFTINEDEADNVRMVFTMTAGGASYNAILRCLRKTGAKTSAGNEFSQSSLLKMLHNEQYNGVYIYNKRGPIDKQIRIPGGMPRIVEERVFRAVQAVLTH